jgi:hypothetical protein
MNILGRLKLVFGVCDHKYYSRVLDVMEVSVNNYFGGLFFHIMHLFNQVLRVA